MINQNIFKQVIEIAFSLEDKKIINTKTPDELLKVFDFSLDQVISEEIDTQKLVDSIFEYSVNTQNPRFLNQLYGGSTKEAWLGELLTAVLNTSMATYEIAPLATLMEKELLRALNSKIGFSDYEGLFVPGGSNANMMGIHLARYFYNSKIKEHGLFDFKKLKVFVSTDAHYSSKKAVELMGLGTESIVKIETTKDKTLCLKDFEQKVKDCIANGDIPLCLVSTSGTTVWGAFDEIEPLNKICKTYNIWHHVDAAWGGLGLWSKNKEIFFKGIELVDSVTMDFHKLMASTLTKAIFITSHSRLLKECNSGGGGKYIFHKGLDGLDIGNYSLQCGRKVDSLALWLQWKLNGSQAFTNKVDQLLELKDTFCELIAGKPEKYKLLHNPEFLNICFQVIPKESSIDISDYNFMLREKLMTRGNFMVNFSRNEHGAFFRLVLSHWQVDISILKEFLAELEAIEVQIGI